MKEQNDINSIKKFLLSVALSPMLIDRNQALNLLFQYNSLIETASLTGSIQQEIDRQKIANEVKFYSAAKNVQFGKFSGDFENVPQNSIAVVPVMGAMMRDTRCTLSDGFISGTRDLEQTFKSLDENQNVDGIVAYINSPGGEARGNESLSNVIRSLKTPVVGYFEGMASAAVYAFQGVDELYAAESGSYWGSIGTYVTLVDDSEFFKSMGVDILEVYAPQSTEKNKEFREALNGNTEPLERMLEKMTDTFIKDVQKSRPDLKDDGLVFKGKLYNAVEARRIGAIDGIKTLDFAINRASILSRRHKKDKDKKRSNNTSILKQETENIMSDQDNKKLTLFERIFGQKTADEAEKDLETMETEIENLKNSVTELTNQKTELENSIKERDEKIDELVKANETHQEEISQIEESIKSDKEKLSETEFENVSDLIDDYKKVMNHNKELGGLESSGTPIDNEQQTSHEISNSGTKKERSMQDIIDQMNAEVENSDEKASEN